MQNPLAAIEFVIFIGVVIWLFTLPSSPLRGRRPEHRPESDAPADDRDNTRQEPPTDQV
ncbi:MAG: hypothetical protein N838_06625 [Thiohalocapsa sp. PB-PSB1]|jgi:hypothetical protein|nr:MAG: hypothetical protein N838_17085 [Thiohalocapsa sp. PB-PSB1]QQO53085.1 MAG: hypothetical protein N838_06625 [Thiohalocapsa sp. PB-PSB1]